MHHNDDCQNWLEALLLYARASKEHAANTKQMKALLKLARPCGGCFESILTYTSAMTERIYEMHIEEVIAKMNQTESEEANVEDMFP